MKIHLVEDGMWVGKEDVEVLKQWWYKTHQSFITKWNHLGRIASCLVEDKLSPKMWKRNRVKKTAGWRRRGQLPMTYTDDKHHN